METNDEKKLQNLPIENMEVLNDELILVKGGKVVFDEIKDIEVPGGGDQGCHCSCG